MKTYSPTNCPSLSQLLIIGNYHFSAPTDVYLFEFSKTNSRIKYETSSKLTAVINNSHYLFFVTKSSVLDVA